MKWTRRYTLFSGLALVGLANAVALGGVAFNRNGEPESTLSLSERALAPPYEWTGRKENSGLALRLQWRVLQSGQRSDALYRMSNYGGGIPAWLDESKMASLGFDVTPSTEPQGANRSSVHQRQLPREVFVVLELNGSAYRMALERAASAAKQSVATNERDDGKKVADEIMDRETRHSSRLFAVDAGLQREALRSRFPDRAKFAIVRGQVRPEWLSEGNWGPAGIITDLSAAMVYVPLEMHSAFGAFEGVVPSSYSSPNKGNKRFEARVAFGQRLEPWLVSATTQ